MEEKNIDPQTLALLLNVGGGIYSATNRSRPKYDIPKSAQEALQTARILAADQQAPGEQRNIDQINLTSANAIRAAQESGNVLSVLPAIAGEANRAKGDVYSRSEADQKRDIQNLMQALSQNADYQDLQYQMNEFAPHAQRQQEMRDILGAAAQNAAALAERNQVRGDLYGDGANKYDREYNPTEGTPESQHTRDLMTKAAYSDEVSQLRSDYDSRDKSNIDYLPEKDVNVSEYYWQAPQKQSQVISEKDQVELLLKLLQRSPSYYPY